MVRATSIIHFIISFLITLVISFSLLIYKPRDAYAVLPALAVPVATSVGRVIAGSIAKRIAARGLATAANDSVYINTVARVSNVAKTIGQQTAANAGNYAVNGLRVSGRPTWRGVAKSLGIGMAASTLLYDSTSMEFSEQTSSSTTSQSASGLPAGTPVIAVNGLEIPISNPASDTNPYYVNVPISLSNLPASSHDYEESINFPAYHLWYVTHPIGSQGYISSNNLVEISNAYMQADADKKCESDAFENCTYQFQSFVAGQSHPTLNIPLSFNFYYELSYDTAIDQQEHTVNNFDQILLNTDSDILKATAATMTELNPLVRTAIDAVAVPQAEILALINQLLSLASATAGYDGMPYSSTDPLTSSDLAFQPSLNSYLSPLSDLEAPEEYLPNIPFEDAVDITNNNNLNPGTNPTPIDWGEFTSPEFTEPELEETPTPTDILQPIFDWIEESKPVISGVSGECPQPTFEALSQTFSFSYHCDIFEQYRTLIASFMLLCWAIISFRITLSA